MSWQAMGWASGLPETVVRSGPFRVLMMLANVAREDGSAAWPSVPDIAATLEVSERTVQRRLVELREAGLITLGDQGLVSHKPPHRRPTVYNLLMPAPRRGDIPVTPRGVTDVSPGDAQRLDGVTPGVGRTTPYPPTTEAGAPPQTAWTRPRTDLEDEAAALIHLECGAAHDPLLTQCDDYRPPPPGWRDLALDVGSCWQCRRPASLTTDDGLCRSCAASDRPLLAPTEETHTA